MPRRIDREERKVSLVRAARAVMLEDGVHALSMSKVAGRAGLAKASVFESYATRDELLDAVYCLPDLEAPELEREGIDSLLGWLRQRVESELGPMRLLMRVEATRSGQKRSTAIREQLEQEERVLGIALRKAMERGRIRSMPPERLACQLLTAADGLSVHLESLALPKLGREARISDFLALWRANLSS